MLKRFAICGARRITTPDVKAPQLFFWFVKAGKPQAELIILTMARFQLWQVKMSTMKKVYFCSKFSLTTRQILLSGLNWRCSYLSITSWSALLVQKYKELGKLKSGEGWKVTFCTYAIYVTWHELHLLHNETEHSYCNPKYNVFVNLI